MNRTTWLRLALFVLVATFAGLGSFLKQTSEHANAAVSFGLTDDERTTLLNQHNQWRAKYQVPNLTWDDTLAALAYDWATQIAPTGTINHRPNGKYGENIWDGTSGLFYMDEVIDAWGNEVNDYNIAANTCSAVCGHFTQVVWSTSVRVGCGKATGAGRDFVVCNYDPPGNYVGVSPFTTLPPQAAPVTPCSTPVLTANPAASVVAVNRTIRFTASATCGGTASYLWWVGKPSNDTIIWQAQNGYGAANTFDWTPAAPGDFYVVFWAKVAGTSPATGWDTWTVMAFTATP